MERLDKSPYSSNVVHKQERSIISTEKTPRVKHSSRDIDDERAASGAAKFKRYKSHEHQRRVPLASKKPAGARNFYNQRLLEEENSDDEIGPQTRYPRSPPEVHIASIEEEPSSIREVPR